MAVADMKLTQKQKVFCEEYIKTGNASDAARKAGYSPKTAPFIGAENLKKPQISAYIKSRLDEQDAALVADANEVLRFYSAVMRGEIRDQFGLDPSLADRIKAADSLAKRLAAADGKPSADMAVKVIIDV
jgi:phage terminase small subunit